MDTPLTNAARRLHARGLHDGWDNEDSQEPKLVTVSRTPYGRVILYDLPVPWEVGERSGLSPAVMMDQLHIQWAGRGTEPFLGLAITVEAWRVDATPAESIDALGTHTSVTKIHDRKLKDHPRRMSFRATFAAGVEGELVIVHQTQGEAGSIVVENEADKLSMTNHSAIIKSLIGLTGRIQGALDATELAQ